jgi:uncharacterized protein (TIGR03546 family)
MVLLFVRVNLVAAFVSFCAFSLASPLVDLAFDPIGTAVLTKIPALFRFWAWMFHAPILPYTNFNNSLVMGSLVGCALAAYPMYWFMGRAIQFFNKRLRYRIYGSSVMRSWRASRLNRLYEQSRKPISR